MSSTTIKMRCFRDMIRPRDINRQNDSLSRLCGPASHLTTLPGPAGCTIDIVAGNIAVPTAIDLALTAATHQAPRTADTQRRWSPCKANTPTDWQPTTTILSMRETPAD